MTAVLVVTSVGSMTGITAVALVLVLAYWAAGAVKK